MQTVIETESYLRAAKDAGVTEAEREAAVDLVATDPEAGDVMQGTGGVRKHGLRAAARASPAAIASSGISAAVIFRCSC